MMDEPTSIEELEAIYDTYRQSGHEVYAMLIDDEDQPEPGYFVECSCGADSAILRLTPGTVTGAVYERLLDQEDTRWWQRGHRTAQDLPWQDFMRFY